MIASNRSRFILSVALHLAAFGFVVIACGYTCTALALFPFWFGGMLGAVFYSVLLLILWD